MERILNPQHLKDLHSSGLTDETIKALGFYSGTASQINAILGFDAGPGLVIPYPCIGGGEPFSRVKPDQPPIINGKPAKYLSPKDARVRAYIPPKTWGALKCPRTPVIITEGEKKSAKTDQEHFPCIGLGGVYAFYQNHQLISDLEEVEWKGRPVTIAYDSDVAEKSEVKEATFVLERELMVREAKVGVIRFKPGLDSLKVGLDDSLIVEGPIGLKRLLEEARPSLFWEIDDIAKSSVENRLNSLRCLFLELTRLEPVELEPYCEYCLTCLGIPRRDFQAQLNRARMSACRSQFVERTTAVVTGEKHQTEDPEVRRRVTALLEDSSLLYQAGKMVQQLGVAGEDSNVRLLYLAVTSRLTNQPISITIKGESSSGKSYIVGKVLELFPPSAYLPMTGMSKQALYYMVDEETFSHRTMVIFERGGADKADYSIRTLQSEGKLIFLVPQKDARTERWVTTRIEKKGPTNFILTTTSPDLHPENETRQWSLIMDESPQQTFKAKLESANRYQQVKEPCDTEIAVWRQLQEELKPFEVRIPYGHWLAEHTPNKPLRIRRDFNKLLALIEVITLLHQRQREMDGDTLAARLEDYFMARELVEQVFPASLAGINKKVEALIAEVNRIYQARLGCNEENTAVKPAEIAKALDTSASSVSRWIRPAIEAGLVEVISETGKGRIKSVIPSTGSSQQLSNLPTIEELAEAFPELASGFEVVHPVTGDKFALEDSALTTVAKNPQMEL